MKDATGNSVPPVTVTGQTNPEPGDSGLPRTTWIAKSTRWLVTAFRVAYVRLRFLLLLGVLGIVIGRWDALQAWTDRGRDWILGSATAPAMISPEVEYFCPMCPGVVTRWPEKCPVCKMPLVRRKIGDTAVLPNGIVARMQLTPYRMQLAGVRTAPASYQSLAAEIPGVGKIIPSPSGKATAVVQISLFDTPFVRVGYAARVDIAAADTTRAWPATVDRVTAKPAESFAQADTATAAAGSVQTQSQSGSVAANRWIELSLPEQQSWPTEPVACVATILAPLADRDPFVSVPHDAPPLSPKDLRSTYTCPDHPDYLFLHSGKCPFDENDLVKNELKPDERIEWWCPAHSTVTSRAAGITCAKCDSQPLIPRVVTYWPTGMVLTVPETAVIEAGSHSIVFVETGPGMFDGRIVELGPTVGGFVPVAHGLSEGDRVVVTSAFLLDAETRLNPAIASAYFGATNGLNDATGSSPTNASQGTVAATNLAVFTMTPRDRAQALLQRTCPVTNLPLGAMGAPIRVQLPDCTFYMCCESCRGKLPKRTQAAATERTEP